MPKTKYFPTFPTLFRRSDRSFLFLSLVFSLTLGTVLYLVSFEKHVRNEDHSSLPSKNFLELKIRRLVTGHPLEKMAPYIATYDPQIAAFLVAIAKKESDWGKFAPQKEGRTCYNYWGYRGPENTTDSGYSCFASPGEAVATVGARLRELLDQGLDTPRKLIVWKRGFLNTPLDASEEKWVSDVAYYAEKLSEKK